MSRLEDDFEKFFRASQMRKQAADSDPSLGGRKIKHIKKFPSEEGNMVEIQLEGIEFGDVMSEALEHIKEFAFRAADPLGNVPFNIGAARQTALIVVGIVEAYKVYRENAGVGAARASLEAILNSVKMTLGRSVGDLIKFQIQVEEGKYTDADAPYDFGD